MKIFALIALLFCASSFATDCNDNGSQPGMFPIGDETKLSSMITALQTAVSNNDRNAVADRIAFPLSTNLAHKRSKASREQFLLHYDEIVNAKVRGAIANARFRSHDDHACVFWNAQGVMLGDGEVWINDDAQGEPKVITINND